MQSLMTTGVALKRMPGFRIAYVEHRGAFNEIGFAFQRLLRLLRSRGLHVSGPMIAIFPTEPSPESDERRYAEAAVPMPQDFQEDNELRAREIAPSEVASLIYEGPPSKYEEALNIVRNWVEDHEYAPAGPIREVYARDLSELPPGILYVEIHLPLRRKRRA